eukprot:199853-Rhodomonas_salina.2
MQQAPVDRAILCTPRCFLARYGLEAQAPGLKRSSGVRTSFLSTKSSNDGSRALEDDACVKGLKSALAGQVPELFTRLPCALRH